MICINKKILFYTIDCGMLLQQMAAVRELDACLPADIGLAASKRGSGDGWM
jgi:hypothetical protein